MAANSHRSSVPQLLMGVRADPTTCAILEGWPSEGSIGSTWYAGQPWVENRKASSPTLQLLPQRVALRLRLWLRQGLHARPARKWKIWHPKFSGARGILQQRNRWQDLSWHSQIRSGDDLPALRCLYRRRLSSPGWRGYGCRCSSRTVYHRQLPLSRSS